jgi:DNA-binding beta-propeller fold protein YncE
MVSGFTTWCAPRTIALSFGWVLPCRLAGHRGVTVTERAAICSRHVVMLAVLAMVVVPIAAPATPPPSGGLSFLGCNQDQSTGGAACNGTGGTARGLNDAEGVAVSPDGANVYVASFHSSAIAWFVRDPNGRLNFGGCIQETGLMDCSPTAPGLEFAEAVAVSPDGANVYVASSGSNAVTWFARDAGGGLSFEGCNQNTGETACFNAPGLKGARGVAVSPDGANVYVASAVSDAIAWFARDANGGLQFGGCIQNIGSGTACNDAVPGLDGAAGVAVSPDGKSVFVASYSSNAMAVFARDANGGLTYAGCFTNTGGTACNAAVPGLGGPIGVAVSPDGKDVYVASTGSDAIAWFARDANGALSFGGCIEYIGNPACIDTGGTAPGLDGAAGVAVSPDGSNVYVASYSSDAIAWFARGANGALSFGGCDQDTGSTDYCNDVGGGTAPGLDGAAGVAVSSDGKDVYVAANLSSAITWFARQLDTTPPQTIKGKGPKKVIHRRMATFHFSSEPGAVFECSLDGKAFKPCTSPKTVRSLKLGVHRFRVLAIDQAGNRDPTPAVWTFKVANA